MKSPGGNPVDLTDHISTRGCLPMWGLLGEEYDYRICLGCWQPLPERDIRGEVPTMELITWETTQEENMALYHQVYQIKRNPREVSCLEDTVEEICLEILETLKECLQHRQGPAQPERESWWRTSRMPAQAEFHAQVQAAYDHFGHHHDQQQESQEEALQGVRDVHHQALATAAMLEGHIEQLSCSISCGWHGSQRRSGSCQWLGNRRHSRSHSCSRSCRRHLLAGPQAWTPPVESHPGDAAKRWADSPSPMPPRRWVTFEDSSSDSNTETIPKIADWSQPIEVDDSLPPSGNPDKTPETADWLQPEEGDLRGLLVLDPKVEEFLSGEKPKDDFYGCQSVWVLKLGTNHPSKCRETIESLHHWEHSNSKNYGTKNKKHGNHQGIGCLKLIIPSTANTPAGSSQKTGAPNIFTQWVKTPPGSPSTWRQMPLTEFARLAMLSPTVETPLESTRVSPRVPPPGFTDIASALRRSQPSQPLQLEEQALPQLVGSTIVMSRMVQDVWGTAAINMMTCQLNVMGLGPTPSSSTITIREILTEVPALEQRIPRSQRIKGRCSHFHLISLVPMPHFSIIGSWPPWFCIELFSEAFSPNFSCEYVIVIDCSVKCHFILND